MKLKINQISLPLVEKTIEKSNEKSHFVFSMLAFAGGRSQTYRFAAMDTQKPKARSRGRPAKGPKGPGRQRVPSSKRHNQPKRSGANQSADVQRERQPTIEMLNDGAKSKAAGIIISKPSFAWNKGAVKHSVRSGRAIAYNVFVTHYWQAGKNNLFKELEYVLPPNMCDAMVPIRSDERIRAGDIINNSHLRWIDRACKNNPDTLGNLLVCFAKHKVATHLVPHEMKKKDEIRNGEPYLLTSYREQLYNARVSTKKKSEWSQSELDSILNGSDEEARSVVLMKGGRLESLNKFLCYIRRDPAMGGADIVMRYMHTPRMFWMLWNVFLEHLDDASFCIENATKPTPYLSEDEVSRRMRIRNHLISKAKSAAEAEIMLSNTAFFSTIVTVLPTHTMRDEDAEIVYNRAIDLGLWTPKQYLTYRGMSLMSNTVKEYVDAFATDVFRGTSNENQRAMALFSLCAIVEGMYGGVMPTDEVALRSFHQMGNKKVGLGLYYSGPNSHVKAFGVAVAACDGGGNFEAQLDSCVFPENRGGVNETVASIGQYLNKYLEDGARTLQAFSHRHGGQFDWIVDPFVNRYRKGKVEDHEGCLSQFYSDMQEILQYEFDEGVRVTRAKLREARKASDQE